MVVAGLDQDPPAIAGPGQRESARQLRAVQPHRQVTGLVPDDLGGPRVPDDDRAAAAALPRVHAFKVASRYVMIFDRNGQPTDCRVQGRSLGHGPGAEHAADEYSQVVMQPGCVMQMHYEPRIAHIATLPGAGPALETVNGARTPRHRWVGMPPLAWAGAGWEHSCWTTAGVLAGAALAPGDTVTGWL